MDGEDFSDAAQIPLPNGGDDQRVYFVPYRWWKEAPESSDAKRGIAYSASPVSSFVGPMKIINNIFNSDLMFNLRREEDCVGQRNENADVGVSGRDYALVPGDMWLQALKWHSDSKVAVKDGRSFSAAEDDMSDVFPLQLRLSVLRETNSLGVKISKKDNTNELFRRACKIFTVESDHLRIWDFSGQTTLLFVNDKNKFPKDCQRPSDQEIILELQVYGLSDSVKCKDGKKDDATNLAGSSGASLMMNGCSGNSTSSFLRVNTTFSGEAGSLGLTGLQNLGNTCFMNSALQCLVHTPKLVDYFIGDYNKEINHENPLGMNGELALAFGDLLRKLWAPGATPVPPRNFKAKLGRFSPQFSGFNQHDSQELLAFLLDGLHEDLNRVKLKPYMEVKDGEGRPDEEVADEYWQNHLARNDSIIVDVCQGQYKSTLVCPICRKVSITFDPFMYLSLPLPSTMMRTMTVTVLSAEGNAQPSSFTVTVPKSGKFEDLIQALSIACSLEADETLLVAEIYNNRIIRFLEDPVDSLSLIRDDDRLVAYRLLKDTEKVPLVVFTHQRMEEQYIHGKLTPTWKALGIPLVTRPCNFTSGLDIYKLYLKLLNPFLIPTEIPIEGSDTIETTKTEEATTVEDAKSSVLEVTLNSSDENGLLEASDANDATKTEEATTVEDAESSVSEVSLNSCDGNGLVDSLVSPEFEFYLTDEKGTVKDSKILMNKQVAVTGMTKRLNVLVCWPEKTVQQYDTRILNSLPEIFKSGFFAKRPQESVSLYNCLEAFLKEEPLGPEDMWYCPVCKKHRQASKKLDLWRLPEILVIHLKRFQYSRFMKNKLETFVDFPINNLDLSTYIAYMNDKLSNRYMLYAVSNHYGSMGGGHYTALVHHGGNQWYDFDDSHVSPISEDKIKTSAAYVLFYRRITDV